jgi:hypothetical protein
MSIQTLQTVLNEFPVEIVQNRKRKRTRGLCSDLTGIEDEEDQGQDGRHEIEATQDVERHIDDGVEVTNLGVDMREGLPDHLSQLLSSDPTEVVSQDDRQDRTEEDEIIIEDEVAAYEDALEEDDLEEDEVLLISEGMGQLGQVEDSLDYEDEVEPDFAHRTQDTEFYIEEEQEMLQLAHSIQNRSKKTEIGMEEQDSDEDNEMYSRKISGLNDDVQDEETEEEDDDMTSSSFSSFSISSYTSTSSIQEELSSFYSSVLVHHREGKFYKPISKLGEGTFSTVYKCKDYISTKMTRHANKSKGFPNDKEDISYVAIKRIYVTSSPDRIKSELEFLADVK